MTKMTSTIDYKALAERVAQRAIYADNNADPNNKAWAADLRTVVSLLNDMAGQKPFAWAIRDGWSQTRFSVDPDTPILGTRRADYVVDALYLHPAPAAPQAEPKREPLSDEREARLTRERDALAKAMQTCVWALRQPLDDWKGECERKALDAANAALAQIEQERSDG